MTDLSELITNSPTIENYGTHLKEIRQALDWEVGALSLRDQIDWREVVARHEYFDGETEIEANYFVAWLRDRRQGPATCIDCSVQFNRTNPFTVRNGAGHFHKEGATR
jgi:hypothetical protein